MDSEFREDNQRPEASISTLEEAARINGTETQQKELLEGQQEVSGQEDTEIREVEGHNASAIPAGSEDLRENGAEEGVERGEGVKMQVEGQIDQDGQTNLDSNPVPSNSNHQQKNSIPKEPSQDGNPATSSHLPSSSNQNLPSTYNTSISTSTPNYQLLYTIRGHQRSISTIKFSPDGTLLISGGSDCLIKLWSVRTGQLIQTFKGHMKGINDLGWSNCGEYFSSASDDGSLRIWGMKSVSSDVTGMKRDREDTPRGERMDISHL